MKLLLVIVAVVGQAVAQAGTANPHDGDPVDLYTGLYERSNTDLMVSDTIPISLERLYRNADSRSRAFGIGTSHAYEMFIVGDAVKFTWVDLVQGNGSRIHYLRSSAGTGYADAVFEHRASPTEFFGSTIRWNGTGWTVSLKSGKSYKLLGCNSSSAPGQCGVIEIRGASGQVVSIDRAPNGNIRQIVSPNGKFISLKYDTANRIVKALASNGKSVSYEYDPTGRLIAVHTAKGKLIRYGYNANHEMTEIHEAGDTIRNWYAGDRCIRQLWTSKRRTKRFVFTYKPNDSGKNVQTEVREPDGTLRRVRFNDSGYVLSDTRNVGREDVIVLRYDRDAVTNNLKAISVSCSGVNKSVQLTTPIGPAESGEGEQDWLSSQCHTGGN